MCGACAGLMRATANCAGVLLLVLSLELSHLQFGQTKPIDFICDAEVRRSMDVAESLETVMTHCQDKLPSPVLCPCIRIHRKSWEQTSLLIRDTHTHILWQFQQKQAIIRGFLDVLLRSLRNVKGSASVSCQIGILEKLEHSVKNHLLIVNNLERQTSTFTPDRGCRARETASLTQTVKFYRNLLRGPVELLADSLANTCPERT